MRKKAVDREFGPDRQVLACWVGLDQVGIALTGAPTGEVVVLPFPEVDERREDEALDGESGGPVLEPRGVGMRGSDRAGFILAASGAEN